MKKDKSHEKAYLFFLKEKVKELEEKQQDVTKATEFTELNHEIGAYYRCLQVFSSLFGYK